MRHRQDDRPRRLVQANRYIEPHRIGRQHHGPPARNHDSIGDRPYVGAAAAGLDIGAQICDADAAREAQPRRFQSSGGVRRREAAPPTAVQHEALPADIGVRLHSGRLGRILQFPRPLRKIDAALRPNAQRTGVEREGQALRRARTVQVHAGGQRTKAG